MADPNTFTTGYSAQSGRFFTILFGNIPIGSVQNLRYTESFGTHWVGEIGSDYKEPEFGMRQVSGSFERLTINTKKLRDLMAYGSGGGDSSQGNVDLRNYQFTLVNQYQEHYLAVNNQDAGVGTTNAIAIKETIYGVMFSDLSFSLSDTTSLSRESGTFIGKYVNADSNATSSVG